MRIDFGVVMNWMNVFLGRLAWKCLLSGAVAGAWAAVLYLLVAWALGPFDAPATATIMPGMALGLGLAGLLGPVDDLNNRVWRRALRTSLVAAGLGMVSGGMVFALMWLLAPALGVAAAQWIFLPLLAGICGAISGIGSGLAVGRLRNGPRRCIVGAVVGVVAGVLLNSALVIAPGNAAVFVSGFAVWGALVSLLVVWGEKKIARRWLRVLTGPGEDSFFALDGRNFSLGKLEVNDIPLLHYNEVFPFHCQLKWDSDHYNIVDEDHGGVVLVNFRQIQEQELKHGDLVKLGSALLQYGEAK